MVDFTTFTNFVSTLVLLLISFLLIRQLLGLRQKRRLAVNGFYDQKYKVTGVDNFNNYYDPVLKKDRFGEPCGVPNRVKMPSKIGVRINDGKK